MQAIIVQQNKINEADLLLQVLTENDYIIKVRIPGVLKSNKRSTNSFFPGNILKFTFVNTNKRILIPKDYELIFSPMAEDPNYQKLFMLNTLLAPLCNKYLDNNLNIYSILYTILKEWHSLNEVSQEFTIDRLYQVIIKQLGLYCHGDHCQRCDTLMDYDSSLFFFDYGQLCNSCRVNQNIPITSGVPQKWFDLTLEAYKALDSNYLNTIRAKINHYLKN